MRVADIYYSVATGPLWRRRLLTPLGLTLFSALLILLVPLSRWTDRALGLAELLPGHLGTAIGVMLFAAGLPLWAWCIALFWHAGGTPVPFSPPRELVARGPYVWVRNPMLTAVFAFLFGLGFCLHSPAMVALWTPVFLLLNVVELKRVEEPELVRRFGDAYLEYRARVPMFVPRRRR